MEATRNSNTEHANTPIRCPTGCGFFGNSTFENYCSQCYRKQEQAGHQPFLSEKLDAPAIPQAGAGEKMLLVPLSTTPTTPHAVDIAVTAPSPSPSLAPATPFLGSSLIPSPTSPAPSSAPETANTQATSAADEEKEEVPPRPTQLTKSKCFLCRAKIPLAMQITNQCRCDYVFCKSHKHPDQHDCDYEYQSKGRELLAKNNQKLDDNRGGRSFTRIE